MTQLIQRLKKVDPFVYGFVKVLTYLIIFVGVILFFISLTIDEDFALFTSIISIPIATAVACVSIWANYIFSGYFYLSAYHKGFDDPMYLRFCFFLGAPGWLLICSLPTKKDVDLDRVITEDDFDTYAEIPDDKEEYSAPNAPISQVVKKFADNILAGNYNDKITPESTAEKDKQTNSINPLYNPKPCPQAMIADENGLNYCPCCDTTVSSVGDRCPVCGQVFANHITTVPYWCKECGQEGPYLGACPTCKNTVKERNPFYVR